MTPNLALKNFKSKVESDWTYTIGWDPNSEDPLSEMSEQMGQAKFEDALKEAGIWDKFEFIDELKV
jgi:hypothetical protein